MPAVPFLIMGGAQLAGGLIQSHQAGKAADAQKAAAQQALGLQTQAYQQGQAGLAPFTQLGQGTLGNLYRMTGQTPPQPTGLGNFGQAIDPNLNRQLMAKAQSANPNSTPGVMGVTMRAPDGSTQVVDPAQVAHFQQLGATVVG